jgi:hypothetical protein
MKFRQVVENEKDLDITICRNREGFQKLFNTSFLRVISEDVESVTVRVPDEHIGGMRAMVPFGDRVFCDALIQVCQKKVTSPTALFSVKDNEVELPSNLESSSDGLIYKMILLYAKLGIKVNKSDSTLKSPDSFSDGWITQFSALTDMLLKTLHELKQDKPEVAPIHAKIPIVQRAIDVMVFKWASRAGIAGYLTQSKKKSGNLSEQGFLDIALGWGTAISGTICQRAISGIYEILSLISQNEGFSKLVRKGFFISAIDMKKGFEPSRTVSTKVKGKTVTQKKGDINVLRLDGIRFLLPSERSELRTCSTSQEVDKLVKDFDQRSISERDYSALHKKLESVIQKYTNSYYQIRRNARNRLYAVKEVRKEAKLKEEVPDSEFSRKDFIESAINMLRHYIVDVQRVAQLEGAIRQKVLVQTTPFGEC